MRPSGGRWAVPNDLAGLDALVARLRPFDPVLIVLEAIGGYELGGGRSRGRAPQSRYSCVLSAPARGGQAEEARSHGLHEEVAHDPECDGALESTLDTDHAARNGLTIKTVAIVSTSPMRAR